jgi:hypothetical protein
MDIKDIKYLTGFIMTLIINISMGNSDDDNNLISLFMDDVKLLVTSKNED